MDMPQTVRLTFNAQEALGNINQVLDGETTDNGLAVTLSASLVVETALLILLDQAESDPVAAMDSLVRSALAD